MGTTDTNPIVSPVARRYLHLQLISDVGPIHFRRLLDYFGSPDAILGASVAELQHVEGVGAKRAESIFRSRSDDAVKREIERAVECNVRIVCLDDPDYPRPLRNIPDSPICLYVRGNFKPTDAVAVAIVGTRKCSHYGREQAIRFGEILGRAGFTIVSGLARGVDAYAHQGALRGGGRTIAVLGNGLPEIYPPEHESLAGEVADHGAVVSEIPLDVKPSPANFPSRNRIIAGLSLGVVVIEAGVRSGALITARLANEYNREVFALPGRVDHPQQTAGVNGLIRDGGAKLITCLEDVLDEFGDVGRIMAETATEETEEAASGEGVTIAHALSADEQAILQALDAGGSHPDDIGASTRLESGRVLATLTSLQLKGLAREMPGKRFARR